MVYAIRHTVTRGLFVRRIANPEGGFRLVWAFLSSGRKFTPLLFSNLDEAMEEQEDLRSLGCTQTVIVHVTIGG